MKKVLIAGGNGMVGSLILDRCLEREDVAEVISILRKPAGRKHPKLKELIHSDFLNFSEIAEDFTNVDACFFCLGVYTGAVPTEQFIEITVDIPRAFFEQLERFSPGAAVCFLSGQGADTKEKSRLLFAKQKGIAENNLLRAGFSRIHIFRPGYIYPVQPREEPNFAYRFMRWVYPSMSKVFRGMGLTSVQLADKMLRVGLDGGNQTIYENNEIKK